MLYYNRNDPFITNVKGVFHYKNIPVTGHLLYPTHSKKFPNYMILKNGKPHNESGPADFLGNEYYWHYNGQMIECNNKEDFHRIVKLKVFE